MTTSTHRKNEGLLEWLRASLLTASTFGGLAGMHFNPLWGAATLSLVAGGLALVSIDLGILTALVAFTLPITAANPVVGIAFAVMGIVGVRYLGADGGRVFLLVAGAIAGVSLGPAWIIVPIAGYLMGPGEGALAAMIACLSVEAVGVATGAAAKVGSVTISGGSKALTDFTNPPSSLFSTEWLAHSFGSIGTKSVDRVISIVGGLHQPLALLLQPAIWALGAAVTALIVREARRRNRLVLVVVAVAVGPLVPAVGTAALHSWAGLELPMPTLVAATVGSALLATGVAVLFERVFPLERVMVPIVARPTSMAMEDADVDELLRLVATAEEKLTTQHTTNKIVMITDVKSFSKMTEEDGSILSAKAIQRHRDLLLPVVERQGGHGKSTGGDGLVAAFDTAAAAVTAAAEMQRTLEAHNAAHPSEREMIVRIGIAHGEVVLDKGGRPFIGTALNLAARVMNLADGGQAYATADVVEQARGVVRTFSHGPFELKNIAAPVELVEILWAPDQIPRAPLGTSPDKS